MSSVQPPPFPPHPSSGGATPPLPPPVPPPAAPLPVRPVAPPSTSQPGAAPRTVPVANRAAWKEAPAAPAAQKPAPRRPAATDRVPAPAASVTASPEPESEEAWDWRGWLRRFDPVREAPPWLVSMILHLILILILGLLTRAASDGPLTLTLSLGDSSNNDQSLQVFEIEQPAVAPVEAEQFVEHSTEVDVNQLLQQNLEQFMLPTTAAPTMASPVPIAPLSGGMMAGRTGASKDALLKIFGGTEQTEDAVKLGLRWLAKQQRPDGSWSLLGPYANGTRLRENQTAATAMAMLAFQGAGNTHQGGEYKEQMAKAVKWLVKQQDREGNLVKSCPQDQLLYSHAQATIALSELLAMTDDSWLRPYVQQAVDYCVQSQSQEGGWRYTPRFDADTSVTGWFVMALMSARAARIEVPAGSLARVSYYLDTVQYDEGATYAYQPQRAASNAMTAEGLLARMYLGWDNQRASVQAGVRTLLDQYPFRYRDKNFYYWYYATQVMHHFGGAEWQSWNYEMRVELPANQVKSGPEAGSWAPQGSLWGDSAGRLYTTCFAIYCLEVYYRHMPLYDAPWENPEVQKARP